MKTVIEMAREAGFSDGELAWHDHMLERFAELVRADERARMATDKSKEAMKLALEALESLKVTVSSRTEANVIDGVDLFPKQMAALQKALANEALGIKENT